LRVEKIPGVIKISFVSRCIDFDDFANSFWDLMSVEFPPLQYNRSTVLPLQLIKLLFIFFSGFRILNNDEMLVQNSGSDTDPKD
jgi:hypothetical protein